MIELDRVIRLAKSVPAQSVIVFYDIGLDLESRIAELDKLLEIKKLGCHITLKGLDNFVRDLEVLKEKVKDVQAPS